MCTQTRVYTQRYSTDTHTERHAGTCTYTDMCAHRDTGQTHTQRHVGTYIYTETRVRAETRHIAHRTTTRATRTVGENVANLGPQLATK